MLESLGSEKYVYFTQELGNVDAAELNELARDSGRADTGASGETVVARLDPATRITEGENVELWLDARKLHVFDPATGQNLTLGNSGSPAARLSPRAVTPPRRPTRVPPGRTPAQRPRHRGNLRNTAPPPR